MDFSVIEKNFQKQSEIASSIFSSERKKLFLLDFTSFVE